MAQIKSKKNPDEGVGFRQEGPPQLCLLKIFYQTALVFSRCLKTQHADLGRIYFPANFEVHVCFVETMRTIIISVFISGELLIRRGWAHAHMAELPFWHFFQVSASYFASD